MIKKRMKEFLHHQYVSKKKLGIEKNNIHNICITNGLHLWIIQYNLSHLCQNFESKGSIQPRRRGWSIINENCFAVKLWSVKQCMYIHVYMEDTRSSATSFVISWWMKSIYTQTFRLNRTEKLNCNTNKQELHTLLIFPRYH